MIALAGLGRMGGTLAERLAAAGIPLQLYDVAPAARERFRVSHASLADAASGCDMVFLCLPDSASVETAVNDLLRASQVPRLVVDLTSSDPAVTRRMGAQLAARGVGLVDAALSGGVAGAQAGSLTAMAGGDPELLALARPILSMFAARIEWAGVLGAGHSVKAINNTLSAVSLVATSRAVRAASAAGESEAAAVAYFNSHRGQSQNSEVKFPRDVLSGTYSAGFSAGLMHKDVRTAVRMGEEAGIALPTARSMEAIWGAAVAQLGPDADFTRIYQFLGATEPPPAPAGLAELDVSLHAACMVAACELLALAGPAGVEVGRALAIINLSTGRSEATRDLAQLATTGLIEIGEIATNALH